MADRCRTDYLNAGNICSCSEMDIMKIEFRNQSVRTILVVAEYGISE